MRTRQLGTFARIFQGLFRIILKEWKGPQKFLLGLEYAKHCSPFFPIQSAKLLSALARGDGARCSSLVLQMHGSRLLEDTLEVCRTLNLRPFLAWGTLLGHYREGGFIAHDYDIDLGLLETDFSQKTEIIQLMSKKGHTVRSDNDYFISFYYHGFRNPYIELQRFYWKNGQMANSLALQHGDEIFTYYFPLDIFDEFLMAKFLGRFAVLVPAQTERFLTVAYGDWRTPQKHWDFLYGPLNLVREKKEEGKRV